MEIENSLELDQIHDKMAHDCSIKSEDSESRSFRDEIRPLARARRRPPKSRCGFHSGSKSDLKPCLKHCSSSEHSAIRDVGAADSKHEGARTNVGSSASGHTRQPNWRERTMAEASAEGSCACRSSSRASATKRAAYSEPREARKPTRRWRLCPYKGAEPQPLEYVHRQSLYLIGRDRKLADVVVDHSSCSKRHAALQHRLVAVAADASGGGVVVEEVRPFVMDLDSRNGTHLNGEKLQPRRYYELRDKDVLKFGSSKRLFKLLLHKRRVAPASDVDTLVEDLKSKVMKMGLDDGD